VQAHQVAPLRHDSDHLGPFNCLLSRYHHLGHGNTPAAFAVTFEKALAMVKADPGGAAKELFRVIHDRDRMSKRALNAAPEKGVAASQRLAGGLSCLWDGPYIGERLITPLQGFCILPRAIPRALPWAGIWRPFCFLPGLGFASV